MIVEQVQDKRAGEFFAEHHAEEIIGKHIHMVGVPFVIAEKIEAADQVYFFRKMLTIVCRDVGAEFGIYFME